MANRKVVLLWYGKTEKGWRRFPVIIGKNGRPKAGYVLVDGEPQHYPEGHFEIRLYQGSKPIYKNVGTDAGEAMLAQQRESALLVARDSAEAAGATLVEEQGRTNLQRFKTKFIEEAKDRKAFEAAQVYELAITEFLNLTGRTFADQVSSDDIRYYWRSLRARGCSDRTVHNRHMNLASFLRYCGVPVKNFVKKAPKFEKRLPEIYTGEEVAKLLQACEKEYHRVLFELLLKTGLRDQEAQHLEWSDIDFGSRVLVVRAKHAYGFMIKDYEQRAIPIPEDLLARLQEWKEKNPKTKLVLGTVRNKPNTKFLPMLKRVAKRAGLNCGVCAGCKEKKECSHFTLHGFRRTYATTLLRNGIDLRTVQKLMGHSDLASTMRYLSPATADEVQSKINGVKWMTAASAT